MKKLTFYSNPLSVLFLTASALVSFSLVAKAQVPTVRFESPSISVSQLRGTAVIPLVIENSHNIASYLSLSWTTHAGTARDRVHYGNNSPYYYGWGNYGGNLNIYPNQSRASLTVPIHYTCSMSDLSFSVELTSLQNVYSGGVGASLVPPSTVVVTIQSAAAYVRAQKATLAKINRKIQRARRIKNTRVRTKTVKRLGVQKARIQQLICR